MRASKNVTKALTTLNNYLAYNMYREGLVFSYTVCVL